MAGRAQRRAALLLDGVDSAAALEGALALSERVGAPVTIALDAATIVGVARTAPELAERTRAAFADGVVGAMLVTAHGAEAALLGADELADELRLDEEALQLVFGVGLERRGYAGVTTEGATLEEAGIDFVLGGQGEPCRMGERLLALPVIRCASVAQAEAELRALIDGGARVKTAAAWAAELTPPWLERVNPPVGDEPPAALRALAELGHWCAAAFGLRRVPGVAAAALVDEAWRLERFPARARVPLVRRRGLCRSRRAWVAAYEWCDVLAVEARVPGLAAHATGPLSPMVLPALAAIAEAHGAGEPMARADAAYEELRGFRFLGGQRWRALLSALRDAFALLAARRDVDWSIAAEAEDAAAADRDVELEQPILRLVEPCASLN